MPTFPRTATHTTIAWQPPSHTDGLFLRFLPAMLRLIWVLALTAVGAQHAGWLPALDERLLLLIDAATWIATAGLALVGLELLALLVWKLQWAVLTRRAVLCFLRLRRPFPRTPVAATTAPDQFWHTLHGAMCTPSAHTGSWLSATIGVHAGEPASLGLLVASPPARRAHLQTLRAMLVGHAPDLVVDMPPDPLTAAMEAHHGATIAWTEYQLRHGPEYLLHISADEAGGLSTPLLAAVAPSSVGVRYSELQLCLQPQTAQTGFTRWRLAMRQRLHMVRSGNHESSLTLRTALEHKLSEPWFSMTVRYVVVADELPAAQQACHKFSQALGQYQASYGIRTQRFVIRQQQHATTSACPVWVRQRQPRPLPPARVLIPGAPGWQYALPGTRELAEFWQLPTLACANLVTWLACRQIMPPPEAFLPTRPTPEARIALGLADHGDGVLAPVGPALRDLRGMLHLTAGMGTGKSRLMANLVQQMLPHGLLLIDGKGDDSGNLTTSVRQLIGQNDEQRLAIIDITDTDWPVTLNPLERRSSDQPGHHDQILAQIESIFARLDPQTWAAAPGMQQLLNQATLLARETLPQPTIAHIRRILIDERYRTNLVSTCQNPQVRGFWQSLSTRSSEQQRSSLTALLRRFDKLVLSDLVRSLVTAATPSFRFEQAIEQRLIVLCPIPHVTYGALAASTAMLLFQAFLRAAFTRPGDTLSRPDYPLLVDEFQVLVESGATQDVAAALSQLRALGVPAIYAHQALAQIGELRDLMLVNAAQRMLLRTQEPDASIYARQYAASGLTAADLCEQPANEHQYVRMTLSGRSSGPFSVRPLPWPEPVVVDVGHTRGAAWQTVIPSGQTTRSYDQELAWVIHQPYNARQARTLAQLPEDEWMLMQARWRAVAAVQRDYILANPGCIPERMERQRWLSRLAYTRPRLLTEIEFLRNEVV